MLALKSGPELAGKTGNPAGLLFRRIWGPKIWGARDNGIPPRSTPDIGSDLNVLFAHGLFS